MRRRLNLTPPPPRGRVGAGTFGQIYNFRDPNLVTFYFYELTHYLDFYFSPTVQTFWYVC